MKKYLRNRRVVLFALLLLTLAFAVAIPHVLNASSAAVPVAATPAPAPVPAQQQPSEQIPVIVLYSTTNGFEPGEITVRPGAYFLMIRNRSGLDDLSFSVIDVKEKDKDKAEKFKTRAALGSNTIVKLALGVGEFTVNEASNPNWICKINVEP